MLPGLASASSGAVAALDSDCIVLLPKGQGLPLNSMHWSSEVLSLHPSIHPSIHPSLYPPPSSIHPSSQLPVLSFPSSCPSPSLSTPPPGTRARTLPGIKLLQPCHKASTPSTHILVLYHKKLTDKSCATTAVSEDTVDRGVHIAWCKWQRVCTVDVATGWLNVPPS